MAGSHVPELRSLGPIGPTAVVASSYHEEIVAALVAGAERALAAASSPRPEVVWVPGALEIPLALKWLTAARRIVAACAVGCVIRGETAHFDVVVRTSAAGVAEVSLTSGTPIGHGVLACETIEQARARSADDVTNKGYEAMAAALVMAALREKLNL